MQIVKFSNYSVTIWPTFCKVWRKLPNVWRNICQFSRWVRSGAEVRKSCRSPQNQCCKMNIYLHNIGFDTAENERSILILSMYFGNSWISIQPGDLIFAVPPRPTNTPAQNKTLRYSRRWCKCSKLVIFTLRHILRYHTRIASLSTHSHSAAKLQVSTCA